MSTPTAYQRVGNVASVASDYDWQNFPLFVRFDGSDDWLQTAAIDFTATDKMSVFAGVRKLNDTGSIIVELSANINSNNGSMALLNSGYAAVGARYSFVSKGTSLRAADSAADFAAPCTDVLTGLGDISGDSSILRVDTGVVATNTADQGTGNFGNYPLYIGRRGGTVLPFNGRLYSLIVRGALSDADEITNAETYVAGKTGVTL